MSLFRIWRLRITPSSIQGKMMQSVANQMTNTTNTKMRYTLGWRDIANLFVNLYFRPEKHFVHPVHSIGNLCTLPPTPCTQALYQDIEWFKIFRVLTKIGWKDAIDWWRLQGCVNIWQSHTPSWEAWVSLTHSWVSLSQPWVSLNSQSKVSLSQPGCLFVSLCGSLSAPGVSYPALAPGCLIPWVGDGAVHSVGQWDTGEHLSQNSFPLVPGLCHKKEKQRRTRSDKWKYKANRGGRGGGGPTGEDGSHRGRL